ncbi:MAG: DUF4012 domain-containing protein [bacterium]|nr:DUF4012 domain-containing protein [bacterium]
MQPEQKKHTVRIHTETEGQLSPYVLELLHENSPRRIVNVAPNLDALQKEIEAFNQFEPAELEEDDGLDITFDDLAAQFLHDEQLDAAPNVRTNKTSDATIPPFHSMAEAKRINHELEAPKAKTRTQKKQRQLLPFLHIEIAHHRIQAAIFLAVFAFASTLPVQALETGSMSLRARELAEISGSQALIALEKAGSAAEHGEEALLTARLKEAEIAFSDAESAFTSLEAQTASLIRSVPKIRKSFDTFDRLSLIGKRLSEAGSIFAEMKIRAEAGSIPLSTKISLLSSAAERAAPLVEEANVAMKHVSIDHIPTEHQNTATRIAESLPGLGETLRESVAFSDFLTDVLGHEEKMRYLLLFQNPLEPRPTGGFAGSFAELDMYQGAITSIHVPGGGTYDLQGQNQLFEAPPKPLTLINPRLEFQDANWSPDFRTSAETFLTIHEASGGPTMDGVISINATVIPKLLAITGPIEMPEYQLTIDAENFLFETQRMAEFRYREFDTAPEARENEAPKQFLADMTPKLLEKLRNLDMQGLTSVLILLEQSLMERDVLLYFSDNERQRTAHALGFDGAIKQTAGDYLRIVHTTLGGGGKTGLVIDQNVDIRTEIASNGVITNHLTVTKTHRGMASNSLEDKNEVDYIRFYVPEGSTLVSANGFEIPPPHLFEYDERVLQKSALALGREQSLGVHEPSGTDVWNEYGKTVFGNYMQTKPGETQIVTLSYTLPFSLSNLHQGTTFLKKAEALLLQDRFETYSMLIEKQPGIYTRNTSQIIDTPGRTILFDPHQRATGTKHIQNTSDDYAEIILQRPL